MPSSGEYVWATDAYYTGVNALSASNVSDVTSLIDGKSAQSTSGDTQVVSLSGGVSTMGSSGGMTCYKAACSSGYYLDAPNSTYFTSTSTTGTIGLTCYKATGCKDGYYNGGSSYDYHGYKCSKCTYTCPSGYSTSTTSSSCGTGYTFKSTSATTQSGCSSKTCGMCVIASCPAGYKSYNGGYCPSNYSYTDGSLKCCQCPTYSVSSAKYDPFTHLITITLKASHQFPADVIRLAYYKVNGIDAGPLYIRFLNGSSSTSASGMTTYIPVSSSMQVNIEVTRITPGDSVCP